MLNRVVLVGRLTRDPEIRFTQNQRAVCSFNLAVNRNYTSASGEREADFINIVVWGRTAENVSKYVSKGSLVGIDGRVQTRNYDNAQGQKVYVTEIVADNVTFLDSKNSNNNSSSGFNEPATNNNFANNSNSNYQANNNVNQQGSNNASLDTNKDPFADFGSSIDISDDDLPF